MPLQQGDQRSLPWQHWRMVPNHHWSAWRMSALPHPIQYLLRENNGWRIWRPWRNSQYRRQDNYKLTFADNIDGQHWQAQELVKLINHLEEASTAYGMQISAEKNQLTTNNTNSISTDITTDNQKLEIVRSFEYLGAIVSDKEGIQAWSTSRIAETASAVTKLKVIWFGLVVGCLTSQQTS